MLKRFLILALIIQTTASVLYGQSGLSKADERKINVLIDDYSKARENRDTVLLKSILTEDIDQLVSTGEWRNGIRSSVQGMLSSSSSNPGSRTLKIEKVRLINQSLAVVDCRYIIENKGEASRMMWSTFVVVMDKGSWKITAIRNMLPSGNN